MRRLVQSPDVKDEKGIYLPKSSNSVDLKEVTDISIDDLLRRGLRAIYGAMRAVEADIGSGLPSRETIMNLKDLMVMLKDLKKEEKEFLDSLSDEDLEKLNANSK